MESRSNNPRDFRSWKAGIPKPPAPPAPVVMASDAEEPSPIHPDIVQRVCSRNFIIDLSPPKTDQAKDYRILLREIGVPPQHYLFRFLSMGPSDFIAVLLAALAATLLLAWAFSGCGSIFGGCQSVSLETRTQIGSLVSTSGQDRSKVDQIPDSSSPSRIVNQSEKIADDGLLNVAIVAAYGTILAFLYAVFQWRMENRQSSMNEFFERKKDINFLLMERNDLRDLLKEAVDRHIVALWERREIYPQVSVGNINEIQNLDYIRSIEKFTFEQKMFVFVEIDNLEFAIEKYVSGYLDDGQMYRACEIFQSRCFSRGFRYLAATQGLVYYKTSLQSVLACLVLRGHHYEEELKKRKSNGASNT